MRSLWAAGLILRRLRTELGMLLLLFLLVSVTSFLFAAAPRLFNRVSDDALRSTMAAAPAAQRNLALALDSRIEPGPGGGVGGVQADGDRLAERLPASLAAIISSRSVVVTSVRLYVPNPPSYETHVSLRYQEGLTDATRLVAGRWPVDRGVPLEQVPVGGGSGGSGQAAPVVVEIALSIAEASEIGVHLGDRLAVTVDGSDPLLFRSSIRLVPAALEVVGLYEPIDPQAAYWAGDASLLQVRQAGTMDHPVAFVTAYVPAAAYPDLWSSGLPFHYEWRFQVDPQRLDASHADQLQADLRRLDFDTASVTLAAPGTVVVRTGLLAILDRYAAQMTQAESMLVVAALGPFCLAAGALGMLAILLVTGRRANLALARGRGASGSLILGAQLWESVVIAGGASLVGLLAAENLVAARDTRLAPLLAIAVGAAAALLLVGATWPTARRPLGRLGRDDPPVLRVAPRRLVIEATVVGLAVAGAMLLRQRGLTIAPDGGAPQVDPLLAAVPALLGLAAGIVVTRLFPLPIRGLGWLAARRRDLVPVLGLRTISRHPAVANLPLLVLMLTAAVGAFSSVVAASIDRGQAVTSYLEVGADFRIERVGIGALSPALDPATMRGVQAVAPGMVDETAPFASTPVQRAGIHLEAVDPRAYAAVTAGTPADPGWPGSFLLGPAGSGVGTDANPIPAILSASLPAGSANLAPGDTFRMTVTGQAMTFRLVERRASFPGISQAPWFAVVPFDWVEAARPGATLPPSVMWLRASSDAAGPLAAAVAQDPGSAHLASRYDVYAALHDAPLAAAIVAGFGLALAVGAMYMALTVIGALVLSSSRRTQDLAYLRTLGVTGRQALALTVVEHAPTVLLAVVPGVLLGIGIAVALEPGLGLASFVGSADVPLFVDWPSLALVVVVLVGVVAVAVAAGTWLSRRARLVDVLRIGDD